MLSDIEEQVVVKHIQDIDQRSFPKRVDHVREMALDVLQEQEGTPTLGKHWIPRFLNRHPHLASKFSSQVKKQRIVNSYLSTEFIKLCSKNNPTTAYNTYSTTT